MSLALGIDVGGSTLRAALVDRSGRIEHAAKCGLKNPSPERLLEELATLLRQGFAQDHAEVAKRCPVALLESGPVGGFIGAALVGKTHGFSNVIALDMGGTTAKTSL